MKTLLLSLAVVASFAYGAEYQNTVKPSLPDDAPPKNPLSRGEIQIWRYITSASD